MSLHFHKQQHRLGWVWGEGKWWVWVFFGWLVDFVWFGFLAGSQDVRVWNGPKEIIESNPQLFT